MQLTNAYIVVTSYTVSCYGLNLLCMYVLRSISSQSRSNEPLQHLQRLGSVPLHALRWKCAMNVQEISEEEEFEVLVGWHTVSLHQWIIYS